MFKTIIIFAIIVGAFTQDASINATSVDATMNEPASSFTQFNAYLAQFGKTYTSLDDFTAKYLAFMNNTQNIKDLSAANGDDVTFSHTQFSDMHPEDFKATYLTFNADADNLARAQIGGYYSSKNSTFIPSSVAPAPPRNLKGRDQLRNLVAPASYDWRTQGVVQAVKNQGQCGDCWAFASVANIESAYAIKHGVLYNFAEQQMLDCSTANLGCTGGSVATAFAYIENSYGLETTYNYGSYLAYRSYCRTNSNLGLAQVTGWYYPGTNEATMASYLWANGPLAIAINATPLQYYSSGIINLNAASCSPTYLDHAVLIVGYGSSNGLNYWIVKNSWGPYWGESGYFRIVRGYGVCGLNSMAITAYVA